ncbi:iron complex outermembrane receptor protein [Acidovorax soli]|uniref:Iron complex outermembrane receptor protein n=1 Tax=Acidovorax soli TaxID=592050 RepID=A0A7X0PDT3_9BURK|nr:TonB-dependent receptor [Acidovorax soli]MBB6559961.1 iron complex outermembrane receptor protein [Acidovorax soli]
MFRSLLAGAAAPARVFPLSPLCTALLALVPLAAAAQTPTLQPVDVVDAAAQPNGRLQLDVPVATGSRLGLTARETPASVTLVDRATIDARGAQDTQEILRAVPGVSAHNAPGSMAASYRGFTANSVAQLYNGINPQYGSATRAVDSWIYERVEAIGGASSFLYGSGGVGGSINYLTKTAERGHFAEGQVRGGSYGLKEVSVGLNRQIAGSSDGAGPAHFARIDLNHRDAGSWTTGTKTQATQLATSLLSDLGGGFTHTLAYEYQKDHVDRPYWGTPVLNPAVGALHINPATRFANYNSADGVYEHRVQWLRSVAQWRVSDALQLRNTFYAYDALRDYRNVEIYTFNAANTAVARSAPFLQRHDQTLLGNRIEGTWQGQLAGKKSDWAFGLDVSVNKQTRFPQSLSTTVSTVNPTQFTTENFFDIPGTSPVYSADKDNKATTTALYLENRTAVVPGLNLVTALRHERIGLDLVNRRAVTAAAPASFSRDYHPTTGRLGLVWDIAPGASLYAQASNAADPPSGSLASASFADVRNNSELTTGRQVEVGSKFDFWDGKGSATVAVYEIRRQNIASQDPANPNLTLLVGEQSSRGIELSAGLRPSAQWQLQGNLALTRARYENFVQGGVSMAGKVPALVPQAVANLWVSYALTPTLTASAGLRHVGKVYGNAANTKYWPSYTLLDLGLGWKLGSATTLTARIRNATDRTYAAEVRDQVYLGAPRTADLTLHTAF